MQYPIWTRLKILRSLQKLSTALPKEHCLKYAMAHADKVKSTNLLILILTTLPKECHLEYAEYCAKQFNDERKLTMVLVALPEQIG